MRRGVRPQFASLPLWTIIAVYAVLYAATTLVAGDGSILHAGALIGAILIAAATAVRLRARSHPAGR